MVEELTSDEIANAINELSELEKNDNFVQTQTLSVEQEQTDFDAIQ